MNNYTICCPHHQQDSGVQLNFLNEITSGVFLVVHKCSVIKLKACLSHTSHLLRGWVYLKHLICLHLALCAQLYQLHHVTSVNLFPLFAKSHFKHSNLKKKCKLTYTVVLISIVTAIFCHLVNLFNGKSRRCCQLLKLIRKRDAGECTPLNPQQRDKPHFQSSYVMPSMKSDGTWHYFWMTSLLKCYFLWLHSEQTLRLFQLVSLLEECLLFIQTAFVTA